MTVNPTLAALFWPWISRLGEAQLLLPLAVAAAAWLAWRGEQRAVAFRWMAALSAAVAVTTASKLAFMGWGLGLARWDFTGFSGHSMFAAATWPLVAWTVLNGRRGALLAGLALATLVAFSRIEVGAHSASEALLGWLLGLAASAIALRGASLLPRRVPLWMPAGLVGLMMVMPVAAPPSFTHDWVTRLSLQLSGRSHPYTRQDLRRRLETTTDARSIAPALALALA